MAVYTHLSKEELAQHLSRFDIGELVSFSGITDGVENSNYHVVTTQDSFILTLFEKRIRPEDLPFYIGFMEYLYDKGTPCPGVVSSVKGERVLPLAGRPSLITTFLEGIWPKSIKPFHLEAVGKTLAQMHLAGKDFYMKRINNLSLPDWKRLIESSRSKADTVEAGLATLLEDELNFLEKNEPKNLPTGAVHADLFPDNVLFLEKDLTGVIDFYFSCTDFFVYDLMLTLNAWCFHSGALDEKRSSAFFNAYQKIRALSGEEKKSLSFFGRAAAVRIIATRLYDWLNPVAGALVKPKDPLEYVRILKFYRDGKFKI